MPGAGFAYHAGNSKLAGLQREADIVYGVNLTRHGCGKQSSSP